MMGVALPRDEYTYSRSVTIRAYAFLAAFAASAWREDSGDAPGTVSDSARFILAVAVVVSALYLWRWTHRRLKVEWLATVILVLVMYPVVMWLLAETEGVAGDALNIAVFVVILLAVFYKLPAPKTPSVGPPVE